MLRGIKMKLKRCFLVFLLICASTMCWAQQTRFNYYFLEAVRQRNLGNYAQSFELYKHALDINPDAPEALFDMARFASVLGTQEEAQRYYERAVELAPQNGWYKQVLANYYQTHNMTDKAISVLEDLVEVEESKSDVYYGLLEMYIGQQNYEKAIFALDQIEQLEGKSEQLSMQKFRIYLQMNQKDKAFDEIDELVKEYPNDLRYRIVMGDLYLDNGNAKKALNLYQGVLKEEPENPLAQLSMASYYEKTGDKQKSDKVLEEIVLNPSLDSETRVSVMRRVIYSAEMNNTDSTKVFALLDKAMELPQDDASMALLTAQYQIQKQVPKQQIKKSLLKVLELDPGYPVARYQLLDYAFKDSDFVEAVRLCEEAISYTPEDITYHYYLGMSYMQLDREENALKAFQNATSYINAETDNDMASTIYGCIGDILHSQGKSQDCYAAYDLALGYNANNNLVLNNYAYYLALENLDLEKAEEMSFKTIKSESKTYNELDTYAWILFLRGKYTEARIYIDESMKTGGEAHSGIVEHAGDIYSKNGETEKAVEYWLKANEMGCDSKTLKKKISQKKYIAQ